MNIYVKTLAEHLQAIDDETAEKDLVIILTRSLLEEYNHLITALDTIADGYLTWDYVRDRLMHENEKLSKIPGSSSSDVFLSQKAGWK